MKGLAGVTVADEADSECVGHTASRYVERRDGLILSRGAAVGRYRAPLIVSPEFCMIRVYDRIADIAPAAWNALAGPHPGLQHAFLDALEQSGSVNADTGWQPCHLTLWDAAENGQLIGAMPLYRKAHSWGEYVFDWAGTCL